MFTSLTKEAMPIIRYRTRDLTRLLPGTARTMRRMGKITGRSDDMLIIRGVNVFPTQIEERVLAFEELATPGSSLLSHRCKSVFLVLSPGVRACGQKSNPVAD